MSIPTSGLAALLVVASLALSSCGSDNTSVTTTTTVSPGAGGATATRAVAAATTTAQATTKPGTQSTATAPAQTTTQQTQTTTAKPKPKPKPKPAKPQAPCPSVDVGARDGDVEETYARITDVSKVNCATVTFVVQQWGGQKIGAGKALLPLGWSCSGSTCRKGSSSVSFVLEFPSD